MKTILETVSQRISDISPSVNDKVIETLVAVELEKRSASIVKGLEKIRSLQNDLKKIRPDVGGYFDEDGNETKPSQYSKEKFDERKKLVEQISKLEKALDSAISAGDMTKLYDVLK